MIDIKENCLIAILEAINLRANKGSILSWIDHVKYQYLKLFVCKQINEFWLV